MSTLLYSAYHEPVSLFRNLMERFSTGKKFRYIALVLAADAVAYALVFILIRKGMMGTMAANVAVSKGMAPVGLALNTFALTGRWMPSRRQASDWFSCWLPTSLVTTVYLAFWVTVVGVEGISARAVVGFTFFPFDYVLKRYVIYGGIGDRLHFWVTDKWVRYKFSELLRTESV